MNECKRIDCIDWSYKHKGGCRRNEIDVYKEHIGWRVSNIIISTWNKMKVDSTLSQMVREVGVTRVVISGKLQKLGLEYSSPKKHRNRENELFNEMEIKLINKFLTRECIEILNQYSLGGHIEYIDEKPKECKYFTKE